MKYKNYYARVEYDEENNILVGHVAGINSIIGFHAEDLKTLEAAFHEAVDAYLDHCAKVGKAPQKAYSGQMMLRVSPAVRAKRGAGGGAIRQKPQSVERGGPVSRRAKPRGVTFRMTAPGLDRPARVACRWPRSAPARDNPGLIIRVGRRTMPFICHQ